VLPSLSRIVLWLFVINLGIALGAGLYEGRIVVAQWLSSAADGTRHWNGELARRDATGVRFWIYVTTIPLTLLTLANLVAGWRAPPGLREWWLGAALLALADRVFTFSYFIPSMVRLMNAADSPAAVAAAERWASLNYLRHAIVLAAWLAALKTFSVVYARQAG
jgi:hypothetical protein